MNFPYPILLGSNSPRRKELLASMGFHFTVVPGNADETIPNSIERKKAAEYLAIKKAEALFHHIKTDEVIITSDTIVLQDGIILNKPENDFEAKKMLQFLSGNTHEVITGVCVMSALKTVHFSESCTVTFGDLSDDEIEFYIKNASPLDKAGAYGIQDWIGLIGIREIKGSFYNVMGLPTYQLYQELKKW